MSLRRYFRSDVWRRLCVMEIILYIGCVVRLSANEEMSTGEM